MTNTDVSIEDLCLGKSTIIKNKVYRQTKDYVMPFIDRMSKYTDDFRIQVQIPDQITTRAGSDDITYNRVWIQAVLPESFYFEDNHKQVIGMVYGLDTKIPVYKFYKGGLNMACTNLCVFSPDYLSVQELEPETPMNYAPVQRLLEMQDKLTLFLEQLHNTVLDDSNIKAHLGQWVDFTLRQSFNSDFGKIKIATSIPISAYKDLFIDSESEYFIPQGIAPDLFTVYNAFTNLITNDKGKDLINKFEKTCLISKMLGVSI